MNSTITPAPKSSVAVRFELPPEQLTSALDEAVRHLARRTRIPGFRPGKAPRAVVERSVGAPAILDEAVDHLVQRAYRDALVEHDLTPLTNADIEIVQAEEGKPLIFKATVQVRPEVKLGDYKDFKFAPEIETIDDGQGRQGHRGAARPERDPGARSRIAAPRTATMRSSASSARETACRSTAARPSGCRSSSARSG